MRSRIVRNAKSVSRDLTEASKIPVDREHSFQSMVNANSGRS